MSNETKKDLIIALLFIALAYSLFGQNNFSQGGNYQAVVSRLNTLERNSRDLESKLNRTAEETTRNLRRIEAAEERASRIESLSREIIAGLQVVDRLIEEAGRLGKRSEQTLRSILEGTESKDQNP